MKSIFKRLKHEFNLNDSDIETVKQIDKRNPGYAFELYDIWKRKENARKRTESTKNSD